MYSSIWWYLRVLLVLHRPEVVDIGVFYYIEKHAICLKDYRTRSFVSSWHAHGDLCKHLGIDWSTDLPLPVYEEPAIRVNTTKSTYAFTSVMMTLKSMCDCVLSLSMLAGFGRLFLKILSQHSLQKRVFQ